MRFLRIEFLDNQAIYLDGDIAGNQGEHLATQLIITLPTDLLNFKPDFYKVSFRGYEDKEVFYSEEISNIQSSENAYLINNKIYFAIPSEATAYPKCFVIIDAFKSVGGSIKQIASTSTIKLQFTKSTSKQVTSELNNFPSPLTIAQRGLNNYEIAVRNGFKGTEKEWLEDLRIKECTQGFINNFLESKVLSEVTLTNLVQNGDFSKGTEGWSGIYGTISAANNILTLTSNGTYPYPKIGQILAASYPQNKKIYISGDVKNKSSLCKNLSIGLELRNNGSWVSYISNLVNSPVLNKEYHLSKIITLPSSGFTSCTFTVTQGFNANVSGEQFEATNLCYIDLTATFGAGNEPTQEQMDRIMSIYPNNFIDKTVILSAVNSYTLEKVHDKQTDINKILAKRDLMEVNLTNLIQNGDFSSDATDWYKKTITTPIVSNNEMTFSAQTQYSGINQGKTIAGNKYYMSAWVKTTSLNTRAFVAYGGGGAKHSGSGNYERLSTLATPETSTSCSGFRIEDFSASDFKNISVRNIIVFNLTQLFGIDKEPTKEEMDTLLSLYPNFWFDGTINIPIVNSLALNKIYDKAKEDAKSELYTEIPQLTLYKVLNRANLSEVTLTNLVTNGDFSKGTTDWNVPDGATVETSNNELSILFPAPGAVRQYKEIISGHKYYCASSIKSPYNEVYCLLYDGAKGFVTQSHSGINNYERLSDVFQPSNSSTIGQFQCIRDYTARDVPQTLYTKYATYIDLTESFGIGNEPSKEEMDIIMTLFPNSWFDGAVKK